MNALIFAAGLGTRLGSITKDTPKVLVKVAGKPMLLYAIEHLIDIGVKRIVVNVHHHASKIISFVQELNFKDVEIVISDESDEILETGGGLLKATPLFIENQPIILYNADVLTNVDLKSLIDFHTANKGIATLMVKERPTSRYFLFDSDHRLSGWENISLEKKIITRESEDALIRKAFSGIHIVEYDALFRLGEIRKFSITEGYLELSKHFEVFGWDEWDGYWFDIGTPEKLKIAESYLAEKGRKNS